MGVFASRKDLLMFRHKWKTLAPIGEIFLREYATESLAMPIAALRETSAATK
jgi:hypothetical protein